MNGLEVVSAVESLRLGGLQESGDSIRMSVAACLMQVGHLDFPGMYVMNDIPEIGVPPNHQF